MSLIRQALAAVAVLITATVVSLIPNQPTATAPDLHAPITATSAPQEDEPGWDCRQVTENSNGVCGDELPAGFAQCAQASGYDFCVAAVREHLGR